MKNKEKSARRAKRVIEEAANKAAEEAVTELEGEFDPNPFEDRPDLEDMALADEHHAQSSPEELGGKDVFRDAWTKAQSKGDVPQYYIYKNGTWIANRPYPYSWEKVQKDYGPGHYRIVAKSTINGQNLVIQSQLVGDPTLDFDEKEEPTQPPPQPHQDPLAFLTAMTQVQERAEAKAAQMSVNQTNMMATMMQTIMQSQTQSQQQFQMMLLEMQKQQQMMAAENTKLLMTMLTQKAQTKDEGGLKMTEILKLMQDAEKNAESRAKNMYELIDKKAEQLAEIKAEAIAGSSEENESFGKTLIKGFVPVLSKMIAQGPGGIPGQNIPGLMTPQMPVIQDPLQKIPAATSGPVHQPGPDQVSRTVVAPGPASTTSGVDPAKLHRERKIMKEQKEMMSRPTRTQRLEAERTKEQQLRFRKQTELLDIVGSDIVQAMVDRIPAKDVTEGILLKLESTGVPRQTVAKLFTLHDFYNHARRLGVPEEADEWLKEFYEAIQYHARNLGPNGGQGSSGSRTPEVIDPVAEQPLTNVRPRVRPEPGPSVQEPTDGRRISREAAVGPSGTREATPSL